MEVSSKNYRVGLILSAELGITDYVLSVDNQKHNVRFYSSKLNPEKYCDLVITDKEPNELSTISIQQKDCHGPTLVINKISNPLLEQQYESIFKKGSLKYKSIKKLTNESITKIINAELLKYLVKENRLPSTTTLLFNKYTRGDLLNEILDLSWLLVPFILIVLYLVARYIGSKLDYSISFLCWFVEYDPNCKKDILGELKLLALIYSFFNFKFYYDYILSIFDNINNDVFQVNTSRRFFHKGLQFVTPLILFVSVLIIIKALFVFKYGFRIAAENSFINIGSILDRRLPFLKDYHLICYFLSLDLCLWLMTKNFFKTISAIPNSFSSNRQKNLIKNAQESFRNSLAGDIIILFVTVTLYHLLIIDPQSQLAVQLILLQSFYLYINIQTIIYNFKFK